MSKNAILNEDIRLAEVRCLEEDGSLYGIVSSKEALAHAISQDLDLVLISPNAKPPVCKIMDYGKYRYQVEKKQKEARKKQKQIELKEIKLTSQIAQNDINYKVKHAREFFGKGYHVKFKVFLKGRERSDPKMGFNVIYRIKDMVDDIAMSDKEPKVEGHYIVWLFVPKKADGKTDGKVEGKADGKSENKNARVDKSSDADATTPFNTIDIAGK